jgi:N-acetylneuraminic acid mutarotase
MPGPRLRGVISRCGVATLLGSLGLVSGVAGAAHAPRLPAQLYRTVAVTAGGRIYTIGGHDAAGATISDVYVFDPATGTSRRAGSLALPTHGAAAANIDGRILVFGGASTSVHDAVQRFYPARGSSRVIGHMPMVRADVTAAVVGHRVLLLGGFNGVGPQRAVWATRNGKSFRVVAQLRQAVRYPAVAALGSSVFVFGGLVSGGEYTGTFSNAIQRVSLPTGAARIVGRLPTPLAHAMAAVIGRHVYVLGGSAPGGPSNAVRRFEPNTGRMTRAGNLPYPLTDAGVATHDGTVYLLGGISSRPLDTITAVHRP